MSRPLSGPTRKRPSPVCSASGRRWPPTPGSTTARWIPAGMYGSVLQRTSAPWRTCRGGMPCVMSMIWASGAICFITPWHVPTKSSWKPKSDRNVMTTAGSLNGGLRGLHDRGDEPVDVMGLRFGDDADPGSARRAACLGADRDRRQGKCEHSSGLRGRRRREHDQVALWGRFRAEEACAVQRHVVRVERLNEMATGALRAGEEDATRGPR